MPFLIPGLSQVASYFVSLLIALVVGFGGGWYTKSQFVKADERDAAVEQTRQVIEGAKEARAIDNRITDNTDQVDRLIERTKKEIARGPIAPRKPRVPVQPQPEAAQGGKPADVRIPVAAVPAPSADDLVCPDPLLSVRAVRLLNAALQNRDPDTALAGDGEGEAASDVGVPALLDKTLEVIGEYHKLAEKHNELVDWVENKIGPAQ